MTNDHTHLDWIVARTAAQGLKSAVTGAGFSFTEVKPIFGSQTKFGAGYYWSEHFTAGSWLDRALLYHVSHGRGYWIGPWAYEIPKLQSSLVVSVGHNTLDSILEGNDHSESTGMMAVRKGAVGVMGTVWVSRPLNSTYVGVIQALFSSNLTNGEAFRVGYQYVPAEKKSGLDITHDATFIGDPTLHLTKPNPLPAIADKDGNNIHDLLDVEGGAPSYGLLWCDDGNPSTQSDLCVEGVCKGL